MEKQMLLPTPGTRAYDLLALTALSGEYPASSVSRLVGSTAYAEKVVACLKADGLLRTVYRDRLRGYRLTAAAKHRLLASDLSRFAFYLTGSTDTNRVKSEPIRRLRLHRVAQVYTSVYKAGIELFRDDKPCPFSAAALHHSAPAAFFGSREVKEMGVETVKIRGSRMVGVLAAPGGPRLCYNCAGNMSAFDRQSELRAKVFFQNLVRRNGIAQSNVTGLLFADRTETLGQVLAQAHTRDREYFLFGEGCEPFYFLTNDHHGDALLRLLYVRAENVTFEVLPTGEIQQVEMQDDFTKVEISKKDITNGDELRGVHLQITDSEGHIVAEWVTDGQPHRIDRLQPGEYVLTETAAPNGYKLAESVRFVVEESERIQKVTMYDAPVGTFTIAKLDETSNTALAGAQLALVDGSGTVIDRWQTTGTPHVLPVLTAEDAAKDPRVHVLLFSTDTTEYTYTLVEEGVPTGYLPADSITFKLMQVDGELTMFLRADCGWQKADEPALRMFDARNPDAPVPEVYKTFSQTGEFLSQ